MLPPKSTFSKAWRHLTVTTQERVLLTSSGERPRMLLKHPAVHRARKKHPVKMPIVPQWRNSALKEDSFPLRMSPGSNPLHCLQSSSNPGHREKCKKKRVKTHKLHSLRMVGWLSFKKAGAETSVGKDTGGNVKWRSRCGKRIWCFLQK